MHQISLFSSAQSSNLSISRLASGLSELSCLGRLMVMSRMWGSGTVNKKYLLVGNCILEKEKYVCVEERAVLHGTKTPPFYAAQ